METIFFGTLSIFQILGVLINSLQILVLLQKDLRGNVTYRLMTWICFSDILSQVSMFLAHSPFWVRNSQDSEQCFVSKTYLDALLTILGSAFFDTFQRISIWLALLICIYDAMKISKPTQVWKVIMFFVLMSMIWSYLVYFQNVIQPVYTDTDCSGAPVTLTESRYQVVIALQKHKVLNERIQILDGFVKLIPTVMELVLMSMLLKNQKKKSQDERTKRENVTTLILVFLVPYILTGVPSTLASTLKISFPESSMVLSFTTYTLILPVLNSISHFFICIFVSPQCLASLLKFFGIRKKTPENTRVVQMLTVRYGLEAGPPVLSRYGTDAGWETGAPVLPLVGTDTGDPVGREY